MTLLLERAKLEANLTALEKQARQAALAAGLAPGAPREHEHEQERAEPDAGVENSAAAAASSRSEDASALKTQMRRAEELQTKLDAAVRGLLATRSMTFASRATTFDLLCNTAIHVFVFLYFRVYLSM